MSTSLSINQINTADSFKGFFDQFGETEQTAPSNQTSQGEPTQSKPTKLLAIGHPVDRLKDFRPHEYLAHAFTTMTETPNTTIDWLSCELLNNETLPDTTAQQISEKYAGLFITPATPYTSDDAHKPMVFNNTNSLVKAFVQADHEPAILGLCGGGQHLYCALASIATGENQLHEEYMAPTALSDSDYPNGYAVTKLEPRFNSNGENATAHAATEDKPEKLLRQSVNPDDTSDNIQLRMFAGFGFNTARLPEIESTFPLKRTQLDDQRRESEMLGFELANSDRYLVGSLSPQAGRTDDDKQLHSAPMLQDFLQASFLSDIRLAAQQTQADETA